MVAISDEDSIVLPIVVVAQHYGRCIIHTYKGGGGEGGGEKGVMRDRV